MPQDPIVSAHVRETSRVLPIYSLHLDVIRGLAALVVFGGHLHEIIAGHGFGANGAGGPETKDVATEAVIGHPVYAMALPHAAVVIFFVLSGLLVGGSVLRDLKRDTFSWTGYSLRRLARLWTVLVPALVLGGALDLAGRYFLSPLHLRITGPYLVQTHSELSVGNFFRYLFFLQTIDRFPAPRFGSNGPLWSLSSEFWYYVLFPLLAISLLSWRTPKILRIVFALLVVVILWFVGATIGELFPIWLFGVLAYVVPAKIPERLQVPINIALMLQFFGILYLVRTKAMIPLEADTLLALSFTLLLYGILHRVGPASRSVYSRIAHGISFPSYTLYALHVPITIGVAALLEARFPDVFRHSLVAMAVVAVPILLTVGLAYLLFERNTDHVRRFFERQIARIRV